MATSIAKLVSASMLGVGGRTNAEARSRGNYTASRATRTLRNQTLTLTTQWTPPSGRFGTPNTRIYRAGRHAMTMRTYAQASKNQKACEYISVGADGSDSWKLEQVVDMLNRGGVGVIPTDTMYAIVCDINNAKGVDLMYKIKDMKAGKPLSVLCRNFGDIDEYTRGLPTGVSAGNRSIFKILKDCFPGPFTLILPASKNVPKRCFKKSNGDTTCANRREVGVRIPADPICEALLSMSPSPLLCTSVRMEDCVNSKTGLLEPARILDVYGSRGLAFVVDGGARKAEVSTVVDVTGGDPVIIRAGKGDPSIWDLAETDVDGDSPLSQAYQQVDPSEDPSFA